MCMQSYSSLQVENHQPNDVMEYGGSPKTEFQRYIRLGRKGKRPSELYWLSFSMNFRRTIFFSWSFATIAASSLCFILSDMLDWSFGEEAGPDEGKLLDHQPLRLNNDDYERVQQIPVKKVGGLIAVVPSLVVSPPETIITLSYDREPTSVT